MDAVTTTISQLADFVDGTGFADLPASVVSETKRLLLDSIGCALAGVTSDKGKWGLAFARAFFAGLPQATVIGFGDRLSVPGAAFVNGELINGLDYDAGMHPGHVSPFVIPPSLAVAELKKATGKELITACALAHELSNRIGGAMGTFRDIVDGKVRFPAVTGYSFSVFGGAAGVAKLERFSKDQLAQTLGLAGHISPMQAQTTLIKNTPPTTAKYLLAGWASQAAITAAYLIRAGHRGDTSILDGDWGYWRFAGSSRWDADAAVAALGKEWRFQKTVRYKPYPCCRIMHGALDALAAILSRNGLSPREIDGIHACLEASCTEPIFNNREIANQVDAQFSVAYNLAVLSFGIKPGIRWQEWDTMNDPEIRRFMDKVTFEPHPDYVAALQKNSQARISRVAVSARGRTFVEEREFPKGTPSPDPVTTMTDEELLAKFQDNASRILPARKAIEAGSRLLDLESVGDVASITEWLRL
jgi:2-methylcitrate dehydratase PrpD